MIFRTLHSLFFLFFFYLQCFSKNFLEDPKNGTCRSLIYNCLDFQRAQRKLYNSKSYLFFQNYYFSNLFFLKKFSKFFKKSPNFTNYIIINYFINVYLISYIKKCTNNFLVFFSLTNTSCINFVIFRILTEAVNNKIVNPILQINF